MKMSIPKQASTVVLVNENTEVYLTKRPASMKFMAGFHVFPGGSVDVADQEIALGNVQGQDESISLAYYVAAARELFEEVGILLTSKNDGSAVLLPKDQREEYRRQLRDGEISFDRFLKKEGLRLDCPSLTYLGQIMTPSILKIRFDTRFFLTKLPLGQTPEPDGIEIDEALWITPEDALAAYEAKEMKLAPPTILTLQALIRHQNGGALKLSVTEDDLIALLKEQRANSMAP